jgi:hypothetical protein
MGMLTADEVAQMRDTRATINQRVRSPDPLITPTLDPETLDPEALDPETSAAPRPRPERRWTVVGAAAAPDGEEDTEDTDGVEDTEEAPPLPVVTAPIEDTEATEATNAAQAPAADADADARPAEAPLQAVAETVPVAAANVEAPAPAPTPVPTVDHAPIPASPREAPAAPIRWVAGPNMSADEVASLMQAIVQTDRLYTGRPKQYGLTLQTLKKLFEIGRLDAEPLLVWLDAAELLEVPADMSNPWLISRPLITRDLTVIAARLAATPLPTEAAIAASFRKK